MARTFPDVAMEKLPTSTNPACTAAIEAAVTDSVSTTCEFNFKGFTGGIVTNVSGAEVTLTYYAPRTQGAYASPLYKLNGDAVTQTLPHPRAMPLPAEVSSIPHLVVTAGSDVTLYFNFKTMVTHDTSAAAE